MQSERGVNSFVTIFLKRYFCLKYLIYFWQKNCRLLFVYCNTRSDFGLLEKLRLSYIEPRKFLLRKKWFNVRVGLVMVIAQPLGYSYSQIYWICKDAIHLTSRRKVRFRHTFFTMKYERCFIRLVLVTFPLNLFWRINNPSKFGINKIKFVPIITIT